MIYNIVLYSEGACVSFQSDALPRVGEEIVFTDLIDGHTTQHVVERVVHRISRYLDEPGDPTSECVGVQNVTLYCKRF